MIGIDMTLAYVPYFVQKEKNKHNSEQNHKKQIQKQIQKTVSKSNIKLTAPELAILRR